MNTLSYDYDGLGSIDSIGDGFPEGEFRTIHSRFEKFINFSNQERVLSVSSDTSMSGTYRIVLKNFPLQSIHKLDHQQGKIIINSSIILCYGDEQVYHSDLPSFRPPQKIDSEKIDHLKLKLSSRNSNNSLSYLIAAEKEIPLRKSYTSFDDQFKNRMDKAYRLLSKGNYSAAVPVFKGCGYGLTPSGDDFIIGLLRGLTFQDYCSGQEEVSDYYLLRKRIFELALGENTLVNTFLFQALHGYYDSDWKTFLTELMFDGKELESLFNILISSGETSGVDMMTGFLSSYSLFKDNRRS